MLIGIAIGFFVGILPGLGGPTTLALMLPFIFKMTPVEAFAFLLALLGITFVASLSGEALLKGLVAGCLGLRFATIGLDPVSGIQRYTFGQLFLWDGVGLVPVTIGFFAIPEVIDLAVQGSSIAKLDVGRLGGVWQGVRDTFTHWWLVLRCSAIGTFIAIIPGMGAATTPC